MDDKTWSARAHQHSMYGFTDLPSVERRGTVVLTHGEGPYVFDTEGRKWLDSNSGLWNMVAGFDHPGLIEAAKAQYDRFPGYHAFFGRMSDQTVMLSEKLSRSRPSRAARCSTPTRGPRRTTPWSRCCGSCTGPKASRSAARS